MNESANTVRPVARWKRRYMTSHPFRSIEGPGRWLAVGRRDGLLAG
jgi:hypothetical protein